MNQLGGPARERPGELDRRADEEAPARDASAQAPSPQDQAPASAAPRPPAADEAAIAEASRAALATTCFW